MIDVSAMKIRSLFNSFDNIAQEVQWGFPHDNYLILHSLLLVAIVITPL